MSDYLNGISVNTTNVNPNELNRSVDVKEPQDESLFEQTKTIDETNSQEQAKSLQEHGFEDILNAIRDEFLNAGYDTSKFSNGFDDFVNSMFQEPNQDDVQ